MKLKRLSTPSAPSLLPDANGEPYHHGRILQRDFFARETLLVAREMLGKLVVRQWRGELLVGRITEVEAYIGQDDLACHASRGRTPRTDVMFGPAGRAYVYLIYGMYDLINIITETPGFPAAVLLRAVEPLAGIETMQRARGTSRLRDLTTGPGKLTRAMRITRSLNRWDCCRGKRLYFADDGYKPSKKEISTSPRIGIDYAGACAAYPWRYYLHDSPFVSRV